ncbi:PspA/IM30 family protein [Microcoleus sp. CAWBG640]|uniref:PspA/IM30 family protein n=1 Tax=Microcoleus sp. CAWBG640 TaxID=2841653 RepID=UPI00312B5B86
MGLFDRLWRVIRANINSLVGAAEDPEKILEQATIDMQEDLVQLRQAVAGAIAAQKRTERQYSQAESTATEWYQRAQLALQKNEENLAREALTRKKFYQETAITMKASLEQQNVVVTKLKENMRALESKISEAKSKKDMYIARARSAAASERLDKMMGNLNAGSGLSAFERMEEKVMQLEARSEAIAELGTNDLEKKFLALESGGDVDAQLAAMKAQMLPGNNTPKLPSGEPPTS